MADEIRVNVTQELDDEDTENDKQVTISEGEEVEEEIIDYTTEKFYSNIKSENEKDIKNKLEQAPNDNPNETIQLTSTMTLSPGSRRRPEQMFALGKEHDKGQFEVVDVNSGSMVPCKVKITKDNAVKLIQYINEDSFEFRRMQKAYDLIKVYIGNKLLDLESADINNDNIEMLEDMCQLSDKDKSLKSQLDGVLRGLVEDDVGNNPFDMDNLLKIDEHFKNKIEHAEGKLKELREKFGLTLRGYMASTVPGATNRPSDQIRNKIKQCQDTGINTLKELYDDLIESSSILNSEENKLKEDVEVECWYESKSKGKREGFFKRVKIIKEWKYCKGRLRFYFLGNKLKEPYLKGEIDECFFRGDPTFKVKYTDVCILSKSDQNGGNIINQSSDTSEASLSTLSNLSETSVSMIGGEYPFSVSETSASMIDGEYSLSNLSETSMDSESSI